MEDAVYGCVCLCMRGREGVGWEGDGGRDREDGRNNSNERGGER